MTKTKNKTRQAATNTTKRSAAVRWTAVEEPVSRGVWWWLGFSYIALLLTLGFIAVDQWLLALVTVAAFTAFLSVHLAPPRKVRVSLTSKAIKIDDRTYPLADYREAHIADDLVLIPRGLFRLRVSIPLPDDDANKILEALARSLDVCAADESALDRLLRWLRLS